MDKTRKCKMVSALLFLLLNLSIALFCGYYVIKCLLTLKEPLTTNPLPQHNSSENDNLRANIENENNSVDDEDKSHAVEVQTNIHINDTKKCNASVVKQYEETLQITDQDIIMLKESIKQYEEFEKRCQKLLNYTLSKLVNRNYARCYIETDIEANKLLKLAISADPHVIEAEKAHGEYLKSIEDKSNSQKDEDHAAKELTSNKLAESCLRSKATINGILKVGLPER